MEVRLRILKDIFILTEDPVNRLWSWITDAGERSGAWFVDRTSAMNYAEERVKHHGAFSAALIFKG